MKNSIKSSAQVHSKAVVAAAVIGLPLTGLPSAVVAQTPAPTTKTTEISTVRPLEKGIIFKLAFKSPLQATIMGMYDGRPVYTNARGEYFYLEPKTGDFQYLSKDQTAAFAKAGATLAGKGRNSAVTILGFDASGNVIQKNAKGEMFYLNAKTGDMVFVK
jgi:hypothetical protein